MPDPSLPLLFLSHAGVDTDAARALKARLLAAPDAQAAGLRVWFDKDDLGAGRPWQRQLEEAIQHRSTAFAVYVGSRGVVNWVDAEVQLGLGRAVTDPSYRFVPVLAPQAPGPEALPGFVALYQGIADVEGSPEAFARLVAAVLGHDVAGTARLEAEPFFGLKAVDEDRGHLFFGREAETENLVALLRREPLVMVTGDSGSGKSSLARAGLLPRWRGGALAEAVGERPGDVIWHVVQARPRTRPFQALAEAVGEAAKRLGLSLADRGTLETWARGGDPDQVRRALWCDLPPDRTRVLLLVDQFEELVTIAAPAERAPFARLLLALADPHDPRARVVLTMRRDYYNLLSIFPELYDRLEADGHRARVILGRISPDGLRRVVTEPLRLAGVPEGDRDALAAQVAAEMGDRPGDLALVQMALTETWDRRHAFDGDLLRAYAGVGRIEGAIARAAEDAYQHVLDDEGRALAEPVFVRLVRLGDTGGATRRLAVRAEFDDTKWRLVQKLASPEGKRLVLVGGGEGGETAEIAHEALVTQWPRYQIWLSGRDADGSDRAADKRALDALTQRAAAWAAAPDASAQARRLATGADLDAFVDLAKRRPAWLSAAERQLVIDSRKAAISQRRHERQRIRELRAALAEARANLIWSKLEFRTDKLQPDELSAIWDLATAEAATRAFFLKQLTENRPLILRFARLPDPVLRAFGLKLGAAQAEQAEAALGPVLGAYKGVSDPEALPALAAAVRALALKLGAAQAEAALGPVLRTFTGASELWELQALAAAVRALAPKLGAAQAEAALGPVLRTFTSAASPWKLRALAMAVQALPVQLDAAQAEAVLGRVLRAFSPTLGAHKVAVPPGELRALAEAVRALTPKLGAAQTEQALGPILGAFKDATTKGGHLQTLAEAVQALPVQLDATQAEAALGPVLSAYKGAPTLWDLRVLAAAVRALAPKLGAAQAEAALGPILGAFTGASEPEALQALAAAVRALAPKLGAAQAEAALGPVLGAFTGASEPEALWELAEAVQALAPKLNGEMKADVMLRLVRSGLGAARSGAEAAIWTRMLEARFPRVPADGYVGALVEALKYPTAALRELGAPDGEPASATKHLLGKLCERFPAARELQGGSLEDALAWIAANHPEVDLIRPPTRPAPLVKVAAEVAASLLPPR